MPGFIGDDQVRRVKDAVDLVQIMGDYTSLKKAGATRIRFLCLVAAPEGVRRLAAEHPDVLVFCASLDRELNEHGYILPGLGDAGDRLFGTR